MNLSDLSLSLSLTLTILFLNDENAFAGVVRGDSPPAICGKRSFNKIPHVVSGSETKFGGM
jgi:hypothetical protein